MRNIRLFLVQLKQWNYLESTKRKIIKDENGENVPHLEITWEVHCNIVNNDFQHYTRDL